MNNKNFLSNIRSPFLGSPSSDVSHGRRSAVVRPSFDCRSAMLKLVSVLVLVFTIGIGQMWGADETLTITGASSGHNAPWGTSYSSNSGSSTTSAGTSINLTWSNVGRMNTGIQIKNASGAGFYSTSYPSTNNIIKSIKITGKTNTSNIVLSCSTNGSSWTNKTFTSGTALDVSASKYKYFKVTQSTNYVVLTSIVVTYTADCDKTVTLTYDGDADSHGTFVLKEGSASGSTISEGGTVPNCGSGTTSVVVVPSANTHYHVGGVSATNKAGISGPDGDGNYTITYTQGSNLSSTVTVSFVEDTKHTLTFYNNGVATGETVEVYDGLSFYDMWSDDNTLEWPELTDGDACHATSTKFAGWTTENVGSTPVHTIDVGKIVDWWTEIDDDMNVHAIWGTIPASATTTFAAADYDAATAPVTKSKDNITLYFDAGQIYKSGTPYTFTITSGNHYFSITASNKVLAKLETTCNSGTYCLYSVSDGTLSPNSSTANQTVTGINTYSVECYPKSSNQIRMQTCAVYCYDNYVTSCASCNSNPSAGTASLNGSSTLNIPF